ncbi:MarR family transcriptional regulator [Vibrio sp. STUT-A11]|uniref:MarR family winged helix-turn-helix transcriptional regulator n=1 Tax=Vibrio sp. STUT-A11 TaxID=2976236 RepID=UPI002231FF8A|nr:MarR family transcriptional regulator [Vibrio sp. STUT-A11]BDR15243.1 hypothetical protein VspSTUT11_32190 [Vibrio sp. STUT-A11]
MDSKSLVTLVAHVTQLLRIQISKQLDDSNLPLTFFQSLALQHIGEMAPCSANDIVVATKKDKAQVTRLLSELGKLGYIERHQSQQDKRLYMLTLTASGLEAYHSIQSIRILAAQQMVSGIEDEQLVVVQQLLTQMEANLESDSRAV